MNIQSYQALNDGVRSYFKGKQAYEDREKNEKLKQEILKRQIEGEEFDRQVRNKQMELAMRADRRAGMDAVNCEMDRGQQQFDSMLDRSRTGRESDARLALIKQQIAESSARGKMMGEKPTSPLGQQLQGIEDYSDQFAAALEENQAALQALQNPVLQTNPAAQAAAQKRIVKAQIRLSALQQISANWGKDAGKEPMVDIEIPGEDGTSKLKMKVPQSQWNPNHPMWGKFAGQTPTPGQPAPAPAPRPALAPEDQQALAWAKANPNDPRAAAILQRLGQ